MRAVCDSQDMSVENNRTDVIDEEEHPLNVADREKVVMLKLDTEMGGISNH